MASAMDVAKVTEDLKDTVTKGIERVQEHVEEGARRGAAQTKDLASMLSGRFETFVRESPLIALGGAFTVGFLIAKLARVRA
jgi:ElaB/YqjD/DUF883 family membrane-anchored ribosome-binding protein